MQHYLFKFIHDPRQVLLQLALPNHQYVPASIDKFFSLMFVSLDISVEFFFPEISSGLWSRGITAALMPVPETTVDEYYSFILGKHYVWLANHLADIFPEPEPSGEQSLPQLNLNGGVLPSYVAHIDVPLLFG